MSVNGRVPPNDLDAEASVLSAMLLQNGAVEEARETGLAPEHFYADANRFVCSAIYELSSEGKPPDVVLVATWLRDRGRLGQIGGTPYLGQLADSTPALARIGEHALVIIEKWRVRSGIAICQEAIAKGYAPVESAQEYLDGIEASIAAVSDIGRKAVIGQVGELFHGSIERLMKPELAGDLCVPMGFREIDKLMSGGLYATDLYIIGARPGMGKTGFMTGIASNVARPKLYADGSIAEPGSGVLFFSHEMGREQIAMRFGCHEAMVDLGLFRSRLLRSDDWTKLIDAAVMLKKMPVYIDDATALTVNDLRVRIRKLKRDIELGRVPTPANGLRLVCIDYLQLMRGSGLTKSSNREQEISSISRGLKELAKEEKLAVVAASQLNRSVERNAKDKRPALADLRESGAIEQDADAVMFLYREEYYDRDTPDRNLAEVNIAKQRNGPNGTVTLHYSGSCTRFRDLASPEYEFDDGDNFDQI